MWRGWGLRQKNSAVLYTHRSSRSEGSSVQKVIRLATEAKSSAKLQTETLKQREEEGDQDQKVIRLATEAKLGRVEGLWLVPPPNYFTMNREIFSHFRHKNPTFDLSCPDSHRVGTPVARKRSPELLVKETEHTHNTRPVSVEPQPNPIAVGSLRVAFAWPREFCKQETTRHQGQFPPQKKGTPPPNLSSSSFLRANSWRLRCSCSSLDCS